MTRRPIFFVLTALLLALGGLALLTGSLSAPAQAAADADSAHQGTTVSAASVQASDPITFTEHTIGYPTGANTVYPTDIDGDGDVDVLGAAFTVDYIAWYENNGSGNFTNHAIANNFGGVRSTYATDVDSDGDVDVLGAAYYDGVAWWENDGSENFTRRAIADTFVGAVSVYATDLDNDGDVDVLGAGYSADVIVWWENNGSENFIEHTVADNFEGAEFVYTTDVDGDGDVDVLGTAWLADDITWWENNGSENFTGHTIDGDFDGAESVYATDLDGDEDVDIVGAAWYDGITWWENDGSENFVGHTIADNLDYAYSVYATDVDGNGIVDVLSAAWYDGIAWWENDGRESFTKHIIDGDFDGARSVYASDIDGDWDMDVLGAAYLDGEIAWWEKAGAGIVATVDPDTGGTLVHTDTQDNLTKLDIPRGAVTDTMAILYAPRDPQVATSVPSGLALGNHVFDLDAYHDGDLIPNFTFEKAVTLTIEYSDADVAWLDEETLALYRWTGSGWQEIGERPPETYTLDVENNVLTAYLLGFSRFSTMGVRGGHSIFLPLVLRNR